MIWFSIILVLVVPLVLAAIVARLAWRDPLLSTFDRVLWPAGVWLVTTLFCIGVWGSINDHRIGCKDGYVLVRGYCVLGYDPSGGNQ